VTVTAYTIFFFIILFLMDPWRPIERDFCTGMGEGFFVGLSDGIEEGIGEGTDDGNGVGQSVLTNFTSKTL
jgi:hypothetical protein